MAIDQIYAIHNYMPIQNRCISSTKFYWIYDGRIR